MAARLALLLLIAFAALGGPACEAQPIQPAPGGPSRVPLPPSQPSVVGLWQKRTEEGKTVSWMRRPSRKKIGNLRFHISEEEIVGFVKKYVDKCVAVI